ncbi:MAG TPA: Pycsar system effector family protein [Parafilimonas sp.]
MGKRTDKPKPDERKEKKIPDKYMYEPKPLDKESEDLFKIAFRNYLNLIGIADKKAGLLIQVNSILASVIIGFLVKKIQDMHLLVIPAAVILIVAGVTIFYSILASKPLGKAFLKDVQYEKQPFFFGSFDKLDPDFKHIKLESYFADMNDLFHDNRQLVFDELIKESFQVRKVLSKKFDYLDIAYKVFFVGLVLVIITFLIVVMAYS